jgi:membrane associated rhomboid family serine protease
MARGADLFVVCKNCGSEVSPYVTECPYCGQRVRKRAPKIERGGTVKDSAPPRSRRVRGPRVTTGGRFERLRSTGRLAAGDRPLATLTLVAVSFLAYLALFAGAFNVSDAIVVGKLDGDWWRIVTAPFVHWGGGGDAVFAGGAYQFATMVAIGIFGTLLERRHGPFVVLAVALLAGAGGMLVAASIETLPVAAGANGVALGLLCAWAVPDLLAWRRSAHYDGDLLGAAVIAVVLLAMPLAVDTADAYAGVTGAIIGLLVGFPLARVAQRA